jgi:hypothetical protein
MRREVAEDSDPDCTKQVKTHHQHETIRTPPGTCNKGVSYSRIQETSRKIARKEWFLPGPKASRIRVQNPIVIMMYGIWYREERSEEKAERSEKL